MYAGEDNFSELLSIQFELRIISIGDLIRAQYKSGSEIGIKIKKYLDNGTLLPTEFVNSILENEILIDDNDILMVNYPRTAELFHGLNSRLNQLEILVDKIWHLKLTNLDYVTQKQFINIGEIYAAKYEITKDTLKEEIKIKQEKMNKIIELWKRDNRVITIDVDYEKNRDMRTYFIEQIKKAHNIN